MQVLCKNPVCYKRDVATTLPDDGLCCPYCGNAYAVHGVDLKKIKEAERWRHLRNFYMLQHRTFVIIGALAVVVILRSPAIANNESLRYAILSFAAWLLVAVGEVVWWSRRAANKKFPLKKSDQEGGLL